jgi:hypothetical protein
MVPKKNDLTDTETLLIHEFRNCVHQINMELDLAERGLEEKFKYADLVSVVDSMTRSLEELRVRLVRTRERGSYAVLNCKRHAYRRKRAK